MILVLTKDDLNAKGSELVETVDGHFDPNGFALISLEHFRWAGDVVRMMAIVVFIMQTDSGLQVKILVNSLGSAINFFF